MTIKFPSRGTHDNKPTPSILYHLIINELKFIDVCLDKGKYNKTSFPLALLATALSINGFFSEKGGLQ